MTTYAAFLGHQPRISLAELAAVVPGFVFQRMLGVQVAIFTSSNDELDQENLTDWGGIYAFARAIGKDVSTLSDVPKLLANEASSIRGKVTFGLRTVGLSPAQIRTLYRQGKDQLKKAGRPSRYVGNERTPAASALLRDAGMISGKHGCEIVILSDEKFFWVGRTVAAQDPDAYTKRDMEKPVRDTRAGLLPPKLAQIMINVGVWLVSCQRNLPLDDKKLKHLVMLDPFCGTGVIPIEALLRGFTVLASDAAAKAVTGCEKNIEWARKHYDIKKKDVPSTVWKQDATKPFTLKTLPDMIITETHLGPALTDRPTAKDAAKLRSENETLQITFLKNAARTLPGVPIVLTWPVWYLKTGPLFLERAWKALHDEGYQAVLPAGVDPEVEGHLSLLYRRPGQLVGREILLLRARK